MELKLTVIEGNDDCASQEINDTENGISFSVHDLYECPEDAVIGRDLFDAYNYIKALNKGIELAGKGYTSVVGKAL